MAIPPDRVQPLTLSYEEARHVLGVSKMTVRRLVQGGRIRRAKLGSRVVLNRDDVLRLAQGETQEPVP